MANIKSAKKRILVTETKTARNKAIKSKVKTYVKKVETAVEKKDVEAAKDCIKRSNLCNQQSRKQGCLPQKYLRKKDLSFKQKLLTKLLNSGFEINNE